MRHVMPRYDVLPLDIAVVAVYFLPPRSHAAMICFATTCCLLMVGYIFRHTLLLTLLRRCCHTHKMARVVLLASRYDMRKR